jgi:hypothetical protein
MEEEDSNLMSFTLIEIREWEKVYKGQLTPLFVTLLATRHFPV